MLLGALGYEKQGARGRGRPTKLNKRLMDEVCDLIRQLNFTAVACGRVGITRQTLHAWRRRGQLALEAQAQGGEAAEKLPKDELIFADFEASIAQAEADRTALLVKLNLRHAARSPDIAWKLLVASDPAYREQRVVEANVRGQHQHEHNVRGGVDHRHAHLHAGAGAGAGEGGVAPGAPGRLTVQGADAIRRDILLGGKPLEQVRAELDAKKKLQGQAPVRALPEKAGE